MTAVFSLVRCSVPEGRQVQRVRGGLGQAVGHPVLRGGRAQSEARGQVHGGRVDAPAHRRPGRGPDDMRRPQLGRSPVRHDGQLPAVQDAPHHR